ncbi:MAG: hypothetical protein M3R39_02845 [Actinomycetota bacterium]|nr:hypothetical protein [Actinomycetota bacterium]
MPTDPTYYTIANAPFFPGLVALLNSLRLTGNTGELVVLDRGLDERQRERLDGHVRLVELPDERIVHPAVLKPYPQAFDPAGVVVILDSDMLVVHPLDWIVERAAAGRICVFPDPIPDRWFPEWADALELKRPLRRGTYLNAGFLAFSAERWPDLLARWWELCTRIPSEQHFVDEGLPFWAGDQDVFNALLANEVPPGAVDVLPEHAEAFPEQLLRVSVLDKQTLACELDGEPATILHYSLGPKAWQRFGWLRLRNDAYVRLLPRLLCADDVPIRLQPRELPFHLRPGAASHAARSSLDALHRTARAAVHATPAPLRARLVAFRNRVFRPLGG